MVNNSTMWISGIIATITPEGSLVNKQNGYQESTDFQWANDKTTTANLNPLLTKPVLIGDDMGISKKKLMSSLFSFV